MVYFNADKPREYYIGVSLVKYTVLISFINGFFYSPRKNSETPEKLYAVVCLINHSLIGVCVL